jgi:site-specific recombinase XerD
MNKNIALFTEHTLRVGDREFLIPRLIADAGDDAISRFLEFFAATIRNKNTREAYARAARDFLCWCDVVGVADLNAITPIIVAGYIEQLTEEKSAPTVKQHLAALRQLFDWFVRSQIVKSNPLAHVRGPRHSSLQGKTPVLMATDARNLIRSIPAGTIIGLRDRALIGLMTYSFARISAALQMNVKDVFSKHHRLWLRLHEKGGKYHEMPCHHNLEVYLREYIDAAGLLAIPDSPLFRTIDRTTKSLSTTRLQRAEALAMVKRRARNAGVETPGICNHTFRGSGITSYLDHPDARLEVAQHMAGHADPKTTRIYDRRQEIVTLDEVERIGI